MVLDDDIEIVGLKPRANEALRCVQLEADGKPVLVLGAPNESHARVLCDFLSARGIDFKTKRVVCSEERPFLNGDRYRVLGMGYFWLDFLPPMAPFFAGPFGRSYDYRMGVDPEQKQRVIDQLVTEGWAYLKEAEFNF